MVSSSIYESQSSIHALYLDLYKRASPATPIAPKNQEADFACDAAFGLDVGEEAAPDPLALPLGVVLEVPLGLPDMFSCVTRTPVLFLQWLS